jgi:hypothetical protein
MRRCRCVRERSPIVQIIEIELVEASKFANPGIISGNPTV